MAILALEKNARFRRPVFSPGSFFSRRALVARGQINERAIVDGEDDNGTGMADDVAAGAHSAGFSDFVGSDGEDGSFICDAGRENARLR